MLLLWVRRRFELIVLYIIFSVSLAYYDREGGRGTKVLQIVITEIGKHSKISAFKKNVFDEITL